MGEGLQSKKEIKILIFAFIIIGLLGGITNYFEYFTLKKMNNTTSAIFEHPLRVSNSALNIKKDIYKMHRDMKDIVLSSSQSDIEKLEKKINTTEQQVYKNLKIIEQNILGEEGAKLQKDAEKLFESWKPIRDEVILLMQNYQIKEAINITRTTGADHVIKLEKATSKLYNYARVKAKGFKDFSDASFENSKKMQIIVGVLFLIIFIVIGYYIINRIKKYISKIEKQNLYQYEVEMALKKEQERYEIAEKLGKVGSWEQNSNSDKLSWSKEVHKIFEIDESIGMSFEHFINRVHPDEREKVTSTFAKSIKEKSAYYLKHRLLFDDGRIKYVIERATHFYDKDENCVRTVGTVQDITDKEDALELINQKKQELETIFNETPTPMAIHNEDGDILMLNKVWEELTGYKHSEIDTIFKWTDKVAPSSSKNRTQHIKNLYDITHRINEGEFEIITKSGEKIFWVFYSAPLGTIDGKKVLVSSAMDITELKKKDEMLIAQSRSAAMGEMISMIAHQWRQPLAIISMDINNMLLDIELGEFNTESAKNYADNILNQTKHLSQTIDDFRNFFKPDKELVDVDLKEVVEETYIIVKDSLKRHNVNFQSVYESNVSVKAYPRELMQVFVNIITNAKDALVSEKIEDAKIEAKVFREKEYAVVEISDNGGGIDDKILPKIFEPYFTTKSEKTGTGLGLYMSKMIIEQHLNGKIEVSNKEIGVSFKIKLLV